MTNITSHLTPPGVSSPAIVLIVLLRPRRILLLVTLRLALETVRGQLPAFLPIEFQFVFLLREGASAFDARQIDGTCCMIEDHLVNPRVVSLQMTLRAGFLVQKDPPVDHQKIDDRLGFEGEGILDPLLLKVLVYLARQRSFGGRSTRMITQPQPDIFQYDIEGL